MATQHSRTQSYRPRELLIHILLHIVLKTFLETLPKKCIKGLSTGNCGWQPQIHLSQNPDNTIHVVTFAWEPKMEYVLEVSFKTLFRQWSSHELLVRNNIILNFNHLHTLLRSNRKYDVIEAVCTWFNPSPNPLLVVLSLSTSQVLEYSSQKHHTQTEGCKSGAYGNRLCWYTLFARPEPARTKHHSPPYIAILSKQTKHSVGREQQTSLDARPHRVAPCCIRHLR